MEIPAFNNKSKFLMITFKIILSIDALAYKNIWMAIPRNKSKVTVKTADAE